MKSFNNKNIEYSLVISPENLVKNNNVLSLKRLDFSTFKVKYEQIATTFLGPHYPIFIRSQSSLPYSLFEFSLLCEEKRKLPVDYDSTSKDDPAVLFYRECEFSNISFSEEDYSTSSAVERFFLERLKHGGGYKEIPFMLCFLERYCMDHDEVVSLLHESQYQKNSFVKQYVKVASHK